MGQGEGALVLQCLSSSPQRERLEGTGRNASKRRPLFFIVSNCLLASHLALHLDEDPALGAVSLRPDVGPLRVPLAEASLRPSPAKPAHRRAKASIMLLGPPIDR